MGKNLLKWIPFSAALLFSCSILIWLSIFRPQLFGPNISGMAIVVVYIALIFAWTFISPAASVCFSSTPLFQACATILPAELLLALTLFWEHRLVGLLVAVCWLIGRFLFWNECRHELQQLRLRCRRGRFRIKQDQYRNANRRFGVLLAVVMLLVPALAGAWNNRPYQKITVEAELLPAEEPEQLDWAAFSEEAWAETDSFRRIELVKELAVYELEILGVPAENITITVESLDEKRLGYYSPTLQQIVINQIGIENKSVWETIDTVAHEAFHAQQRYVVTTSDWNSPVVNTAYYAAARQWRQNYQEGYISASDDPIGYYKQPIEKDAREYAKVEMWRLSKLAAKTSA